MTSWQGKAALALRLVLGALFVYAAWSKLRQPWALFALSIDAYGLLPEPAVIAVARTLPWAELLLGALLASGRLLRVSAAAASALLVFFLAVMIRSYFKGLQIDCGCFGVGEALSWRTLARDATFLAASLALTLLAFRRPQPAGTGGTG
jgi:uncharacterized membrane protein YphA (DoxX/SURF4 family)